METGDFTNSIQLLRAKEIQTLSESKPRVLPRSTEIKASIESLLQRLPPEGFGLERATDHLLKDVAQGLNAASLSPNYYGFVTGGVTPAARIADNLVTLYDQNVQVHLPEQSVATIVEDKALAMLMELLDFGLAEWPARTFTTGATASNILGLACGREYVILQALRRASNDEVQDSVGELGLLGACRQAGIERIQVLTTMPHSSLRKAASIVGLGRVAVVDVGNSIDGLAFDMEKLETELSRAKSASIVVVSCGEINTGQFATHSREAVVEIKRLCNKYGAWLHVDGGL